jgi:YD repeat-containing protein
VHVSQSHAINEATGKTEAKEVVRVFERETDELVVIRLANGEEIRATPEHPFWVEGKGWTTAGNLRAVDRLTTTSSTSAIASIEWQQTTAKVYNFEVKDHHTYFVSVRGADVWVHNACDPIRGKPGYTGGVSKPDPNAVGSHTTLIQHTSKKRGETYRQGYTWDKDGKLVGRTDLSHHDKPHIHSS